MVAGGEIVPALSLDLLRVGLGAPVFRINTDGLGVVSVEKLPVRPPLIDIPTDKNGRVWVHFSPHEHDIDVSAKDVLEGTVALDRIAGKLILIGTSAVGLLDIKTTPVDPAMPGVEIHAQLLEAVLTGSILSYPGYAIGAELIAAFLVGIAIVILAPMIGALPLLILGAGSAPGLRLYPGWSFSSRTF
jgi:adenylate cyclase